MWDQIIKVLIGVIIGTAIVAVILNWDTITNWFIQHKNSNSVYGTLIKEALDSGNYNVVAGVFNSSGVMTDSNKWDNVALDQDVLQKFRNSKKIKFKLTN